ncbi:DsbA family protein [Henriciella marina]|uniref:DsbA family protein n=1 Tax=Henriciella marina TaxID=453851 RepID=UPI000378357D|nr:DsbA family protein [Henriciella marina]
MKMNALTRRSSILAVSFLMMAACGASGDETGQANGSSEAALQEISLGADDAPVTIVEYASWTCPACLQFHNEVVGNLKEDYVDTGKVRYVFREFPTAPAEISVAGFAIARCAGEDSYYDVLDELFSRQTAILSLARQGGQVKQALQQVAANHGISDPAEFDACLQNSDVRRAISASVAAGDQQGVNATPTVFLNGEQLEGYAWRQWPAMQEILNEELGEEAPGDAEEPVMTDEGDMSGESMNSDAESMDETEGEAVPQQ